MLPVLTSMPGFGLAALTEGSTATTVQRVPLWRAALEVNTSLCLEMTPEQVQQELERGPVLMPHPGAAVPLAWNITYERLSAMPGVTSSKNDFGGPTLTLAPVRLCGLLCAEIKVYQYYNREDAPVHSWSASITVVPQ